ncbi:MAG: GlsB/YeaQ/YmgE family stress response membrane protein [Actinomycetota bacterium]|nr:GlsB/YeaQ/YmgE family stress response membrane protein [Actinomycetota bacterium]
MGIIGWILLGLVAGVIAKAIMPGDDPGGIIVTIVIGIVGALLGGFLASRVFGIDVNEEFFDLATWVAAIAGALILLAIYRVVAGGRAGARVARRGGGS